ncbi:MAG: hypothetical protein QXU06_03345, partial [Candidatus Bathyarchaeia archaeon]
TMRAARPFAAPGARRCTSGGGRLYPLAKEHLKAVADEYGLTHVLIPGTCAGPRPFALREGRGSWGKRGNGAMRMQRI